MGSKVVFISYSHDSEIHKERVLGLAVSLRRDGIDVVLDQHLKGAPVEGWPRWMMKQVKRADRVLIVCTRSNYRRFGGHEGQGKGKGADWEANLITQELYDAKSKTVKFVPILFEAKDEKYIPEPLRSRNHFLVSTKDGFQSLYDELLEQAGVEAEPLGPAKRKARAKGKPLHHQDPAPQAPKRQQRIAPSRLPCSAAELIGRETELADMEAAWNDPAIHVVTLVAWGGVGKTSLVTHWAAGLMARGYEGADYFDWSFDRQGTGDDRAGSSDAFLSEALRFFGAEEMAASPASPWEKGASLAKLIAEQRTLLILDGLEPLQHPPGSLAGELKDLGMTALLKGLAAKNSGLCIVTTREAVKDLAPYLEKTVRQRELDRLTTAAGVRLLKSLGVRGTKSEIEKLIEDVVGHALTLNLLGTYLAKAHGGDVRRRDRIDLQYADRAVQGGHAFKAMAAYERWLPAEGDEGARHLELLRLLGLFDRPADSGCLAALRKAPVIPGLTGALVDLSEETWNLVVSALVDARLLTRAARPADTSWRDSTDEGSSLDAHPLLREYFARRLREEHPEAWRAAHSRLYEHLRDSTDWQPDTLKGLQPLFQAVAHGCLAGRQQEACDQVYDERISRGRGRSGFFGNKRLGAFGADLGAVACFFENRWSKISTNLTKERQAWLLSVASFNLRALGRLTEARTPLLVTLDMRVAQCWWEKAAQSAGNLSELELLLGDVANSVRNAQQAVVFADRGTNYFEKLYERSALADAFHQAGQPGEALKLFHEAEDLQVRRDPIDPQLRSLQGFRFCDLLLAVVERQAWRNQLNLSHSGADRKKLDEVDRRAKHALGFNKQYNTPLDIGLHRLTLGRTLLYRWALGGDVNLASSELDASIDSLRHAGQVQFQVLGFLSRAWLRFLAGEPQGTASDLAEAQEIAEHGPMPLHLADIALHRARLFRDSEALATARGLIEKHGYWRRKEELEDAEAAAISW